MLSEERAEHRGDPQPTPAEAAWEALVQDRGGEPEPHRSFLDGWDACLEWVAAAGPPPPGPQGGY